MTKKTSSNSCGSKKSIAGNTPIKGWRDGLVQWCLDSLATDATMSKLIARFDLIISDFEEGIQEVMQKIVPHLRDHASWILGKPGREKPPRTSGSHDVLAVLRWHRIALVILTTFADVRLAERSLPSTMTLTSDRSRSKRKLSLMSPTQRHSLGSDGLPPSSFRTNYALCSTTPMNQHVKAAFRQAPTPPSPTSSS